MWSSSKILKPTPAPSRTGNGPVTAALPSIPARPSRVLQSSRTPQQLSFEFRRG